jgi:hypothetical protein
MTPTRRLTIARMINAVTVTLGTAWRRRSMSIEIPAEREG